MDSCPSGTPTVAESDFRSKTFAKVSGDTTCVKSSGKVEAGVSSSTVKKSKANEKKAAATSTATKLARSDAPFAEVRSGSGSNEKAALRGSASGLPTKNKFVSSVSYSNDPKLKAVPSSEYDITPGGMMLSLPNRNDFETERKNSSSTKTSDLQGPHNDRASGAQQFSWDEQSERLQLPNNDLYLQSRVNTNNSLEYQNPYPLNHPADYSFLGRVAVGQRDSGQPILAPLQKYSQSIRQNQKVIL